MKQVTVLSCSSLSQNHFCDGAPRATWRFRAPCAAVEEPFPAILSYTHGVVGWGHRLLWRNWDKIILLLLILRFQYMQIVFQEVRVHVASCAVEEALGLLNTQFHPPFSCLLTYTALFFPDSLYNDSHCSGLNAPTFWPQGEWLDFFFSLFLPMIFQGTVPLFIWTH